MGRLLIVAVVLAFQLASSAQAPQRRATQADGVVRLLTDLEAALAARDRQLPGLADHMEHDNPGTVVNRLLTEHRNHKRLAGSGRQNDQRGTSLRPQEVPRRVVCR